MVALTNLMVGMARPSVLPIHVSGFFQAEGREERERERELCCIDQPSAVTPGPMSHRSGRLLVGGGGTRDEDEGNNPGRRVELGPPSPPTGQGPAPHLAHQSAPSLQPTRQHGLASQPSQPGPLPQKLNLPTPGCPPKALPLPLPLLSCPLPHPTRLASHSQPFLPTRATRRRPRIMSA